MLDLHTGELLVRMARQSFESLLRFETLKAQGLLPSDLREKRGVYVRVRRATGSSSSGNMETLACLGYPFPTRDMAETVTDAAVACAVRLTASNTVGLDGMENLLFEVSVLSMPELLQVGRPAEYPKRINVRTDGVIIEHGFANGVILPQVSLENKYDENDLLCECSVRAGLNASSWLNLQGTRVYRFQAEVFRELESAGTVIKVAL